MQNIAFNHVEHVNHVEIHTRSACSTRLNLLADGVLSFLRITIGMEYATHSLAFNHQLFNLLTLLPFNLLTF